MRKFINLYAIILALPLVAIMSSCEPRALTEADVMVQNDQLDQLLANENPEGYTIYTLNEFLDTWMTETGNLLSDSTLYRTRSTVDGKFYMFSVDTLPTNGKGIYIRGRVTTDDFGGNFYKSLVIQQIVDGKQQNLRISADLGSAGGLYQTGQEILIRCNGLAVGRYSNQPQLCVPSYNNNIFAMNASEKVGWAPGRIPSAVFRKATRLLGSPDQSKLVYDTLTLTQLFNEVKELPLADSTDMDMVRKADGRLIVLKNVWFTGQFDDNGTIKNCTTEKPDSSGSANVFAPTTQNIGYPQSRIISNGKKSMMCSSSEYAKFARYYIPGATKNGVSDCENWVGTVTGILGWYQDKATSLSSPTGYEWSITPRGIPGIGFADIYMEKETPSGVKVWEPKEYDPKDK